MEKKKMVNHPNRKPITHEVLTEDHTSFYAVERSFNPGALRSDGIVTIAGWNKEVPLFICVEWDSRRVLVGYHWQGGNGFHRAQIGLEEWFWARHLVDATLGSVLYSDRITEDWRLDEHNTVLEVTRFCQALLNRAEEVTDDVKLAVRNALNTGNLIPFSGHTEIA